MQRLRGRGSGQIIVLGMHRSGTSATAGLLHACGAHVGAAEEIKAPSRVNPRGFFERWDVRAVCDGALQAAGADWWKMSGFHLDAIPGPVRRDLDAKAAAVVAGLDRHPVWAMKDPRLCLTLPLFREHLDAGAACVLVLRHPLEIANSLQHRDGFPLAVGLALWEAYVAAALRNSVGMARVVMRYADLATDAAAAGGKLIQDLAQAGVEGLSQPSLTEVIDPTLRHYRSDELDDEAMTPFQRTLWRSLESGGAGRLTGFEMTDEARAVLEAFEPEFGERLRRKAERAGAQG